MEHAEGSILIDAPLEDVMEVIEDYESYPEWADVNSVAVNQRGEGAAPPRWRSRWTCRSWARPPTRSPTSTRRATPACRGSRRRRGGAVRDIRGEYLLNEIDEGTTKVTYRLAVELGVLVPGFLRTEGAKRVIENALEKLKRRVEMG